MENTQTPKKDLIYLIIAFLLLVIVPIIAGIEKNVDPTYYLLPFIMGTFLLKYLYTTYIKLKESQYE